MSVWCWLDGGSLAGSGAVEPSRDNDASISPTTAPVPHPAQGKGGHGSRLPVAASTRRRGRGKKGETAWRRRANDTPPRRESDPSPIWLRPSRGADRAARAGHGSPTQAGPPGARYEERQRWARIVQRRWPLRAMLVAGWSLACFFRLGRNSSARGSPGRRRGQPVSLP